MSGILARKEGGAGARSPFTRLSVELRDMARIAGPPLLFGFRLWASVCLALYVAFWVELDSAVWAGTTAAIVCQPHLGASLRKGWFRMVGTIVGATAMVVLTACFPQQRAAFLVGLALWCAGCALVATLLRNFAGYAVALAGYTAAIVASDQLGATGGPNGLAFTLALTRVSEICIGIVSAGIVLAGTDLGGARRRLAALFAALSAEIASGFTDEFDPAGPNLLESRPVRRSLLRKVIGLDPVIDEAIGESSRLRSHSAALQAAVRGLFAAVAGWRIVATHLAQLPTDEARRDADAIRRNVPPGLRSAIEHSESARWMADPIRLRQLCGRTARELLALPATTPSLRLLGDQTARVLAGISDALDALGLLVTGSDRSLPRLRGTAFGVADWWPPLINAGRAFVTISAVALFWIVTEWPNGATAMLWAAVPVILFAPRADQAYGAAMGFMVGNVLASLCAAIVLFAVLPNRETFAGLSVGLGLYLVPAGALLTQPWQTAAFTAMVANFVPFLAPENQMSYDTAQFYNSSLALIAGNAAGVLSFRLIPPLSPSFRTRRLLALTLRDLRRLASGPLSERAVSFWEGQGYRRLSAFPDEASPLQRAQLLAVLAMGIDIVQLRRAGPVLGVAPDVVAAVAALGEGRSAIAVDRLSRLDRRLAARPGSGPEASLALRTRSSILAIVETAMEHSSYLDGGASA